MNETRQTAVALRRLIERKKPRSAPFGTRGWRLELCHRPPPQAIDDDAPADGVLGPVRIGARLRRELYGEHDPAQQRRLPASLRGVFTDAALRPLYDALTALLTTPGRDDRAADDGQDDNADNADNTDNADNADNADGGDDRTLYARCDGDGYGAVHANVSVVLSDARLRALTAAFEALPDAAAAATPWRLWVGRARLDAGELASLQIDDILLFDIAPARLINAADFTRCWPVDVDTGRQRLTITGGAQPLATPGDGAGDDNGDDTGALLDLHLLGPALAQDADGEPREGASLRPLRPFGDAVAVYRDRAEIARARLVDFGSRRGARISRLASD